MDRGQIFVLEFIALVMFSAGLTVLLSWKTRKPSVALLGSLTVIALVFGGLIVREISWPRELPADPVTDPYSNASIERTVDEDSIVTPSNVRVACNLVSLAAYLVLLGWSWKKLVHEGVRSRRGWRTVAGFLSLTLVTISAVLYVITEGVAVNVGRFSGTSLFAEHGFHGLSIVFAVLLAAGWSISVAALILAIFGTGWRRISSLVLSVANVFLWSTTLAVGTLM